MNPLAKLSADALVEEHSKQGANSHFVSEMLRRLMVALETQERSSTQLGNRLWWLNAWLLLFTVAIFALTFVLSWDALRELWGIG